MRCRPDIDGLHLAVWVGALAIGAFAVTASARDARPVGTQQAGQPARTKAQEKIDTRLRAAIERLRAREAGAVEPGVRSGAVDIDKDGRALVDIEASVSTELRTAIETAGGQVLSEFPQYNAVRARVSLSQLEKLAERADVKLIRTADQAITSPSGAGSN